MNIKWSDNQKKIFDLNDYKDGKIIVKACPGSGKTTCVSERIVKFIQKSNLKQQGLAVLSFTNVAIEEINKYYKEKVNTVITYPNYIGTIDSFLNKFIFLPFGYLVMGCNKRPILVGEPHSKWFSHNYENSYFDKLSKDVNGNIVPLENKIPDKKNIYKSKEKLNMKGFATQDDSNYFSMEILKKYPQIAKIIIEKFPYFIIDEAQDMSSIQIAILNLLIENGLENILLMGDPNQAIFEWRTAEPKLFDEKYQQWSQKHKAITLNETYRCSNIISTYLSKLSGQDIISKLDDNNSYTPCISGNNSNLKDIIEQFKAELNKKNIEEKNAAILFRTKNDLNNLNNQNIFEIDDIFKDIKTDIQKLKKSKKSHQIVLDNYKIKSYSRNIVRGIYHLLNNNFQGYYNEFETAYFKIEHDKYNNIHNERINLIQENGFYKFKKDVFDFMTQFKKPANKNELINDWIKCHNNLFEENINNKIYINSIKTKHQKSKSKLDKELTWNMLHCGDNQEISGMFIGTIHSAKGKTFDAVLLILNSNCTNMLGKKQLTDNEELRNLYVGMSRAKYYLHIIVPNKDLNKWKSFFENSEKQYKLEDFK